MKNYALAKLFYEMADAYEIKGVQWKPRAYRRAGKKIEQLGEDIENVAKHQELKKISGLGEGMRGKVEEYINTGKISKHEQLLNDVSKGLLEIKRIPGLGAAKIRDLRDKLGISNINELKAAAKKNRISEIEGFGKRTEKKIMEGIEQMAASENRYLLNRALKSAEEVMAYLKKDKKVVKLSLAGSLRRMRSTIGDIDLLVLSADAEKTNSFFVKMPDVSEILRRGNKRTSVRLNSGINVDLRFIDNDSWGSALLYFTGSKEHSIVLRNRAIEQGYKLNEYGLFKGDKKAAGKTEAGIYSRLGLSYIEPELRENSGELEAAEGKDLPDLVENKDILGDLHVHSDWSDGESGIEQLVAMAKDMGYRYICISDHSRSRAIANGLGPARLRKQIEEIRRIDKKNKNIKVMAGLEVDILGDGSLDMPDKLLAQLDVVIASIHSGFRMGAKKITERIIRAIKKKQVKIIGHPTGRIINQRSGYRVDLNRIIQAASEYNTALEVNASPERLDLRHVWIRKAIESNVKLAINTDAHMPNGMKKIEYGLGQARRGWAEKGDIINTYGLQALKKWLAAEI